MPTPHNKETLIAEIMRERDELKRLLGGLSPEVKQQPGLVGPWSVKDVMAHLAAWEEMFLGWYSAGLRGEAVKLPAPGYNWDQLPQLNQAIYERNRDHSLQEIETQFAGSFSKMLEMVRSIPEEDFFTPGRFAWTGKHALINFVGANTSSHYRWARNEIRKGLKTQK